MVHSQGGHRCVTWPLRRGRIFKSTAEKTCAVGGCIHSNILMLWVSNKIRFAFYQKGLFAIFKEKFQGYTFSFKFTFLVLERAHFS